MSAHSLKTFKLLFKHAETNNQEQKNVQVCVYAFHGGKNDTKSPPVINLKKCLPVMPTGLLPAAKRPQLSNLDAAEIQRE